jgi:MFS family permease
LTLSVLLMAGGSLLIAVSPTYEAVGLLAPLLLLVARAVQGLSAGGETSAMTTYVIELAPRANALSTPVPSTSARPWASSPRCCSPPHSRPG